MIRALATAFLAVCLSLTLGCKSSERQRPMGMGAVDQGVSSLESVRRQLLGTWELVGLELAPKPGATRVPVAAAGVLTYDEYANLTIDAKTTDPAAPVAAREVNLLSFRGRAAIDPVKKELRLMNLTGNANPDEVPLAESAPAVRGDGRDAQALDRRREGRDFGGHELEAQEVG